jgi:hypothetical protein
MTGADAFKEMAIFTWIIGSRATGGVVGT